MRVLWSDFAKRRNIDIKTFQNHVSYEQYTRWCDQRNVEPVTQEVFETPLEIEQPEVIEEELVVPDMSKLNKLKKAQITDLLDSYSVEYVSSDTKRQLIQKLKNKFGL